MNLSSAHLTAGRVRADDCVLVGVEVGAAGMGRYRVGPITQRGGPRSGRRHGVRGGQARRQRGRRGHVGVGGGGQLCYPQRCRKYIIQ